MGPSPRGRGNPQRWLASRRGSRSIPAWAGKPRTRTPCRSTLQVHPRVGGETASRAVVTTSTTGPSPRGRGNPRPSPAPPSGSRSIPAWAGKPVAGVARAATPQVHPRVGGETMDTSWMAYSVMGPSPRGRGNLHFVLASRFLSGSIPAWAGKPCTASIDGSMNKVHPRVGGETGCAGPLTRRSAGPSPRGRGNRRVAGARMIGSRSIPAWAGKPRLLGRRTPRCGVHPRVGGETPSLLMPSRPRRGPSPRGRGNPISDAPINDGMGSIPAWAGKPLRHSDPVTSRMSKIVDCLR